MRKNMHQACRSEFPHGLIEPRRLLLECRLLGVKRLGGRQRHGADAH
jgi:hypothetical protein